MSSQKERTVRVRAHNGRIASVVDNTVNPVKNEPIDANSLLEEIRNLQAAEDLALKRLKSSGHIKRKAFIS